jgi:dTDP-3-amino-3,4,6-trideoxy-alpha-D-glucose transaminase
MIPFNDLKPAHHRHRHEYEDAIRRVFARGAFILGPELEAFEAEFAAYHGTAHAVGVASGTDALELALRAAGIGPGDEVITASHTAVATVCAVERARAHPVLVDIDPDTYTLDPAAVEAALTPRTRALLPVHLYGHPADLPALAAIARRHGLCLIEDCAQAHGARHGGKLVGTFGDLAAFSFYPTKNLGAFGDAGAVLTSDAHLAERLRRLRNYCQAQRYHHAERGVNSRLDELQAALLRVRLTRLEEYNAERCRLAGRYRAGLSGVGLPQADERRVQHAYHLFVVRHPARDRLRQRLQARGVETLVHYPVPVHLQPAYADLGYRPGSLPATERAAREVLSLPLYVGLGEERVARVAEAVAVAAARREAA